MNLYRTLPLAVLGLAALGACSSGTLEGADDTRPPAVTAAPDLTVSDDDTPDASTGDSEVDEMIVSAVWESESGKASICPLVQEAHEIMPTLDNGEIFDMSIRMADVSSMTPAQLDQLRQLVIADC